MQRCAAHEGTQDAGYVLRTVHSLENCITVLQDIVYNERIIGSGRQVEFLISVGRSMEEIAQTLLISRRTLYRRCEEFQICKKRERYSQLSDCDLDDIMRHLISEYPTSGLRMLSGHLLRMGVRVPRERLRESLLRVDSIHNCRLHR